MPDIRDVLKGLDADSRAVYTEVRTQMRRAYLYAHSKALPIEQYNQEDDNFLDMIDIKIAMLFDRAGVFNHVEGHLNSDKAAEVEQTLHQASDSLATRMMRQSAAQGAIAGWGTPK